MPSWDEVLQEIKNNPNGMDDVRRRYLKEVSEISGRNTIAYYSGFLQKPGIQQSSIDDNDKNGFMATIHKLERKKGLDIILHTQGGGIAAAESLVNYLRSMFGNNIRAIIPQMAMSAGTMIACSCKSIIMGKQSSIGPIDPQYRGLSTAAIVEEFDKARKDIISDPKSIPLWQPIISKYTPTLIGECQKSIMWSKEIVEKWLKTNMFQGKKNCDQLAKKVVDYLGDHENHKAHERHIDIEECKHINLVVEQLEEMYKDGGKDFQDAVLSAHHAYMLTFASTSAYKIIENQNGIAMISNYTQPSTIPLQMKRSKI